MSHSHSSHLRKRTLDELNRLSVEAFRVQKKRAVVLVLDDIRSMNNVGSIFRTADAFSVEKIFLCGITASPPHREIQKTALGATESVSWAYARQAEQVLRAYRAEGCVLVAVEQTSPVVLLQDFAPLPTKKYVFVVGNEVKGVSQEVLALCDFGLEIPQFGTKHSLNVSVSTGIVLWDYLQKTL